MTVFSGLKVLVVEDEGFVALLIENMLLDLGCEIVASVARLTEAQRIAASVEVDLAVLDVNLNGQPSFPVAEILRDRGVPFIFSTGYGQDGLPHEFADRPLMAKPFSSAELQRKIAVAVAKGGPSSA